MHKRPLVLYLLPLWLGLLLVGPPPVLGCERPLDLELIGGSLVGARALYLSDPEESERALAMLRDLERRMTCTSEPVPSNLLARLRYQVAFLVWTGGNEPQARNQLAQAFGLNPELEGDSGLGDVRQMRAFQSLAEQVRIEQVYGVLPAQVTSQVRSSDPPLIVNGQGLPTGLPRKVPPGKLLIQQRTEEGLYQGQWILVSSGAERILTDVERMRPPEPQSPGMQAWQVSLGTQRLQPLLLDQGMRNFADLSLGLEVALTWSLSKDRKLLLVLSGSPTALTLQDWGCAEGESDCSESKLAAKMRDAGPFLSLLTQGVQVREGRALPRGGLVWYGPELRLVEQTWGMVLVRSERWLEGSWLGGMGGVSVEAGWPMPSGFFEGQRWVVGATFSLGLGGMWETTPSWDWHSSGAYLAGIWLGLRGPQR